MCKRLTLGLLIVLLMSSSVNADFNLGLYRKLGQVPETKEKLRDYVTGVGRGIFWANVMLGVENKVRLFCMPKKLSLDEAIIQSLLDQEIKRPTSRRGEPYENDTPIELILTTAFINRFPCDK